MTQFTVIIPAHNEEAVIGRCLTKALQDAPAGHSTQFIVAANGCADRTVEVARAKAPGALILDLAEGSKPYAMNAANEVAKYFPRIYLDADVQCDYHSLLSLANALRQKGVMAGSPSLSLDLSRSSYPIKSYYRVWQTQPYVTEKLVGSGCYGISREAHERIGAFPQITGDDIWVRTRFRPEERVNVSKDAAGKPVFFVVTPPRRAIDQIRVETRRRLGNQEMIRLHPSPYHTRSNAVRNLQLALRNGVSPLDLAFYIGIKALVRLRLEFVKRRNNVIVWERDEAARQP
ncbi:glycosyltransferase [Aurantiacibacter sp. MUD11]|nr:glycosyltransferase [Aurantiacibacter sp. MUD11]WAT17038.1 glycosyltransferase [Aurantiacibacter sp. MUD11]